MSFIIGKHLLHPVSVAKTLTQVNLFYCIETVHWIEEVGENDFNLLRNMFVFDFH